MLLVLGRAAVPDHVAGVLRVVEHVADRAGALPPECTFRVYRLRRRERLQVRVEMARDRAIGLSAVHPKVEDGCNDGRPERIECQAGLVLTIGTLGGDWMTDLVRDIAIRRLSHVEALVGVNLDAAAAFLQHFEDVPLRDTLLRSSQEDEPGLLLNSTCLSGAGDRFVGGKKRDAKLFQIMLNLCALVCQSSDAVDRLADNRVESPQRIAGLCQQIRDPTIPRDWYVELTPGVA
jgi:hypothetical protein